MAEIETKDLPTYTKDNPFRALLTENSVLSGEGSTKDTRHFVVDIAGSGLTYTCGDSLGIYPTNPSSSVDQLLDLLGMNGNELVRLPKTDADITLREALSRRLNLAQPNMKMLGALLEKVSRSAEKTRLLELLERGNRAAMRSYLENREYADLLLDFPSAIGRFDAKEFVLLLRRLVPRLYSIASSPTLFPDEVHLTVAVVGYETNGRTRVGVCSTYLSERVDLNDPVLPVFIASSHFGLPEDDSEDLIMIGPGTGVAPFRAFIQERKVRGATGRLWLFFGDQHEATEYLYGQEFEAYLAEGTLTRRDLAWSRDQEYKVYVQDKMLENRQVLWQWLQESAYIYVCGDARRMAKDVDAALHQIAREDGGMEEKEAVSWVRAMRRERRYQRDVY